MVLEEDIPQFGTWLASAVPYWLFIVGMLALGALVMVFLIGAAIHGPMRTGDAIYRMLRSAFIDIVSISPRRVWALARLAVQEALRRRVLAGIAVFVIILMFALWFLDANSPDPASLYLDFVLTATTYLVLMMALILSALSLPNDLKNRTITTVVTKPVRPSEIVLGRIVGFSIISTVLLAAMGAASYFFVVRALKHTHEIAEVDLVSITPPPGVDAPALLEGKTGLDRAETHRHRVSISTQDGQGATDANQRHRHDVHIVERDGKKTFDVSGPIGIFQARVPLYGELRFKDRSGADAREGVNVGNEWTYRSYVEGGSLAAGIWTFRGVTEDQFPEGLPLHMTIRVFRTYKGDVEKPVVGSITLRNPRTGLRSSPRNFSNREYSIDERFIPRELSDSSGKTIDLFKDLVDNGDVEVWLTCIERGQYFGMAKPDVYLLAREASFELNFVKGFVTIWLQVLVVTAFGVMWSTFLNGAVAMLATLTTLVGGFFVEFMTSLVAGENLGGGTFESLVRIATQKNVLHELDPGLTTTVVTSLDKIATIPLAVVSHLVPNFRRLSDVHFVSSGYDIPIDLLLAQTAPCIGYLIPVFIAGFLFFKMREVAK